MLYEPGRETETMRISGATILTALGLLATTQPARAADCGNLPRPAHPRVVSNDNRVVAGTLRDGVLTLRLVMREASWYPDGPGGCALRVRAFAEEGGPARIPGPLIRVRTGTEVRVSVRNALSVAQWVRGLQARDVTVLDSIEIAPGTTREIRFRAGAPGAWYYWAGAAGARVPASNENGQLVGALVVDPAPDGPPGAAAATLRADDRVFVMTRWTPRGTTGNRGFQINALNGRSWPNTERLTYARGDTVRWHVINASDELHMMHLHGFYFRVDSRGDAAHDSVLARQQKLMAVTTATRRGEWISIAWSPDRSGNWIFHCHFVAHMSADQRLEHMGASDGATAALAHGHPPPGSAAGRSHAAESMAGLVLGITVTPPRGAHAARRPPAGVATPARTIDLFANSRPRVYGERPGYGFVVQQGDRPPAPDSLPVADTPLVLTRGEPVRITVHNRLAVPLAVHWHGIELESYADGVGGWSGMGRHIAPMIAPGGTFIAAFTPPRAGTFMYHVHNEHGDELASGLHAPLLVVERDQPLDPRIDRVLTISAGGPDAARSAAPVPSFINGSTFPDTLRLVAGTRYRFRIIDISSNEAHMLALTGPVVPLHWRQLARDGWDVSPDQALPQPARVNMAAGVTRDFEVTPPVSGDYRLTVTRIVDGRLSSAVTVLPIRVE
ncbi:MAG TPA: multicopper oxidase domain-containing protein [Gemmatimonadaceae bacterium]|nr:multicopper oxidase domain-containing protein [Gemmatimonadaceae bacterium]